MRHIALTISLLLQPVLAQAAELNFVTESYPPFSFQNDDGKPDGAGVVQVEGIMQALGDVDYSIEVMPWARALALAETQDGYCVFAAAQTLERMPKFHWVLPLLEDINLLVAREGSDVTATGIEDATALTVGTQREDYTEGLLREAGFGKIDLSANFDLTLAKLLGGRIDLMAMSEPVFDKLRRSDVPLRRIGTLSQQSLGIACNRQMDGGLVARMQSALDEMRASGRQMEILERFGVLPAP